MTTIGKVLKQETLHLHQQVEVQLDLLDPALSGARLVAVLERFHGFWSPTEDVIDVWASAHGDLAAGLEWPRRRRAALFATDLAALGSPMGTSRQDLRAAPLREFIDHAGVLGWLYVVEGSTLGGAIVQRHLGARHVLGARELKSFTPYAEGPGAMWQRYGRSAQEFVADDPARTASVLGAAIATFQSLERWLRPLAHGTN